jgi:hypothetical protein
MGNKRHQKARIERLKDHQAESKHREFYSIQRLDLLVISLSGGGLYVVFEAFRAKGPDS